MNLSVTCAFSTEGAGLDTRLEVREGVRIDLRDLRPGVNIATVDEYSIVKSILYSWLLASSICVSV